MSVSLRVYSPVSCDSPSQESPLLKSSTEYQANLPIEQRIREIVHSIFPVIYLVEKMDKQAEIKDNIAADLKAFVAAAKIFEEDVENTSSPKISGKRSKPLIRLESTDFDSIFDIGDLCDRMVHVKMEFERSLEKRQLNKKTHGELINSIKAAKKAAENFVKKHKSKNVENDGCLVALTPVLDINRSQKRAILKLNQIDSAFSEVVNMPFKEGEEKFIQLSKELEEVKDTWAKLEIYSKDIAYLIQNAEASRGLVKLFVDYQRMIMKAAGLRSGCSDLIDFIGDEDLGLHYLLAQLSDAKFDHKREIPNHEIADLSVVLRGIKGVFKRFNQKQAVLEGILTQQKELQESILVLEKAIEDEMPLADKTVSMEDIEIQSLLMLSLEPKLKELRESLNGELTLLNASCEHVNIAHASISGFLESILGLFRYLENGQSLRHARKNKPKRSTHAIVYEKAIGIKLEQLEIFYHQAMMFMKVKSEIQKSKEPKLAEAIKTLYTCMESMWNKSETSRHESSQEILKTGHVLEQTLSINGVLDIREYFPSLPSRILTALVSAIQGEKR